MAKAPNKREWKAFLDFSKVEQEKLWTSLRVRGQKMSVWSWGWRMAWLRSCFPYEVKGHCLEVAEQGRKDKAAVVRAEVAKYLGMALARNDSYTLGKNLEILERVYNHPKNFRNGKPLMVPYKVLDALAVSRSPAAKNLGKKLSSRHPIMRRYWQKQLSDG